MAREGHWLPWAAWRERKWLPPDVIDARPAPRPGTSLPAGAARRCCVSRTPPDQALLATSPSMTLRDSRPEAFRLRLRCTPTHRLPVPPQIQEIPDRIVTSIMMAPSTPVTTMDRTIAVSVHLRTRVHTHASARVHTHKHTHTHPNPAPHTSTQTHTQTHICTQATLLAPTAARWIIASTTVR